MDSLQNDRIIIAAFVSILVGFITAVLSIVRLVNDKESKTTDYRQGWTESLRTCIADLISNINSLAGEIVRHTEKSEQIKNPLSDSHKDSDAKRMVFENQIKTMLAEEAHIRELRKDMFKSYSLTRLHFKPNEETFTPLENKFDVVLKSIERLEKLNKKEDHSERIEVRGQIYADAAEITGYGRSILKSTWEAVKKGEKAYQATKRWSLYGGAFALFVLMVFALFAIYNAIKNSNYESFKKTYGQTDQTIVAPPSLKIEPSFSTLYNQAPLPSQDQTVNVLIPGNCSNTSTKKYTHSPAKTASSACKP